MIITILCFLVLITVAYILSRRNNPTTTTTTTIKDCTLEGTIENKEINE